MTLLAVDIGGTKIEVGRVASGAAGLTVERSERFASAEFTTLGTLLKATGLANGVRAVGIGVAGPVIGRRAQLTNLPWAIDADAVAAELGVPVAIVNDLEAHGHGLAHARPDGLVTLNAGKPRPGNRALIAAGTGLGQGFLFWDGKKHVPSASEGGHTDFAPHTAEEVELLAFLLKRYEHVSWERVVSGRDGFRNLYDFLVATRRIEVPARLRAELDGTHDIGHEIGVHAAAGEEFARTVWRWFVKLYGAESGNLALKAMSVNGFYLAGGIAQRHVEKFKDGTFLDAFFAKGRFAGLLRDMPVHVVVDPQAALKGAAAAALGSLGTLA